MVQPAGRPVAGSGGPDSRLAVQQTALVEQALVALAARMKAIPKAHNLVTALYPMLCSMEFRPNLAVNARDEQERCQHDHQTDES